MSDDYGVGNFAGSHESGPGHLGHVQPAGRGHPGLGLGGLGQQSAGTCWYALAYFLIAVGLPTVYVIWAVRTGRISDFHMAKRDERMRRSRSVWCVGWWPGCSVWAWGLRIDFVAPVLALYCRRFSVLDHAVLADQRAHGGHLQPGDVCLPGDWTRGPGPGGLVPLVAWARVYLGRHTVTQTIVGACLGAGCFVVLFALHGVVW